jgi:hypothetical protein
MPRPRFDAQRRINSRTFGLIYWDVERDTLFPHWPGHEYLPVCWQRSEFRFGSRICPPPSEGAFVRYRLHDDQLAIDVAAFIVAIQEQKAIDLIIRYQHGEVESETYRIASLCAKGFGVFVDPGEVSVNSGLKLSH